MSRLWWDPTYTRFLKAVVLSAFTSFLFGWHVHEKAALLFLVPMTWVRYTVEFQRLTVWNWSRIGRLLAKEDYQHFRTWIIATSAGIFGLFPLLIKPAGKSWGSIFFLLLPRPSFHVIRKQTLDWYLVLVRVIETPIKILYTLVWCSIVFTILKKNLFRWVYLCGWWIIWSRWDWWGLWLV